MSIYSYVKSHTPNFFVGIFGNPEAEQAQLNKRAEAIIKQIHDARTAGNRALELSLVEQLKAVSNEGSLKAREALKVVDVVDGAVSAVDDAAAAVGDAVGAAGDTVKKVAVAGGALLILYAFLRGRG